MTEAARIFRLSKHGKFRVEHAGYVLLCHCKYLQDFRLPLHHLEFLRRLATDGVGEDEVLSESERDLLDDLRAVLLLDDAEATGEEARARAASLWDRVTYANEEM